MNPYSEVLLLIKGGDWALFTYDPVTSYVGVFLLKEPPVNDSNCQLCDVSCQMVNFEAFKTIWIMLCKALI
jgi:hypothetical protein